MPHDKKCDVFCYSHFQDVDVKYLLYMPACPLL